MNLQKIQEKRKGISPIIATLLLILIAIAAGVIVYAYVVGFIGASTSNTGNSQSVLSVENYCISASTKCQGNTHYYIVIRNVGTTTLGTTNGVAVYFTDITAGTVPTNSTTPACSGTNIAPGQTFVCSGALSSGPSAGDTVSVKVVAPDGGASTSSTKSLS